MNLSSWLNSYRRRSTNRRPGAARRGTRLRLEPLEDRDVPAQILVTSNLDDGSAGTLRWATQQANATAEADVIDLTGQSGTITLTGGQLRIGASVDIIGPGAERLAIS